MGIIHGNVSPTHKAVAYVERVAAWISLLYKGNLKIIVMGQTQARHSVESKEAILVLAVDIVC